MGAGEGWGESDTRAVSRRTGARAHTSKTRRRYQPCDNVVIVDLALGVPGNFPVGREDDGFGFGGRWGRQVDHIVGDNHFLGGGREREGALTRTSSQTYVTSRTNYSTVCLALERLERRLLTWSTVSQ